MAPEIMQLQKYDAKADLWSVGTILFQLVTGTTPFTGNNQIQLLQNILKSNGLSFPPDNKDLSSSCTDLCQKLLRHNPVERLTFDEFFNHPFLSLTQTEELSSSRMEVRPPDGSRATECRPRRHAEESSQDDCLPFLLDDDSSGSDGSPSFPKNRASMRSTYGFHLDTEDDKRKAACNTSTIMDVASTHSSNAPKRERHRDPRSSHKNLKESSMDINRHPTKESSQVVDSLEFIDQEYVIVPDPPVEMSSPSVSASRPYRPSCKSDGSRKASISYNNSRFSAPVPIISMGVSKICGFGSLENHSSAPSETSHGSMDTGDALEQPSAHSLTRIRSLQQYASAIRGLLNEKIEAGRQLEAFSIQLVILAVWKQALHICHTHAASAIDGSLTQETTQVNRCTKKDHSNPNIQERMNISDTQGPGAVFSQIEKGFLLEVGNAEELAMTLDPIDGSLEMPDAMETIFQSALALGRHGAVDELMGDMERAVNLYSKAVCLLNFLLAEGPSLILNPPFSLTNSDRIRLRTYMDILNNRQSQSNLLKC